MSFKSAIHGLLKTKYANKILASVEQVFSVISQLRVSLNTHDYWGLLFIGCLSLFIPRFWIVGAVYLMFKTSKKVARLELNKEPPKEIEQLILFIHMNHLQSLTEAIESNPQLLYMDYKKKSLLHWCNHYNNNKALMVIMQMTQKYPKTERVAA